jgi:uncharacterized protein
MCAAGAYVQALAQGLQSIPALSARVVDTTNTLTAQQRQTLEGTLAALEQRKGSQVVVLIVPTTQPEDITSYANRVANDWKIGRKAVGDGVLVIVAKTDRKLRIEVAKTLEGALPDLLVKQIIDEALAPKLKQGDYAGGLTDAVDRIAQRIDGEALPQAQAGESSGGLNMLGSGFQWMDIAIFMLFAIPIGGAVAKGIFGNKLGSLVTGGAVGALAFFISASLVLAGIAFVLALLFTLLSSMGGLATGRHGRGRRGGGWTTEGGGFGGGSFGGDSSSGGGGGGFSSGGGGDFGGGGSSGDY